MSYAVGSLVRARGREWVVLPESSETLLHVKPLGATDLEATAILPALEPVEPAQFSLPSPERLGDERAARLLRDAVRLGFRASAGPFRALGSVGVEPRPYQLVPLLMALRQNPVRLLIGDDVGIGKTVEAALIAKELLARGEAERLCILCPPHLSEQWQMELETKFNIEAQVVLPSTVARLERQCPPGLSVFEHFPATIVSTDYIKSERRRDDFLRTCPELVIVDEAHTCTQSTGAGQLRFQLLRRLAESKTRHVVLVTATPHSGNEQAFRSLLSLLDPSFTSLPDELGGDANRPHRERLAAHFVQRRRKDITTNFIEDTPFPERLETELTYTLHADYRAFFDKALRYAREQVADTTGTRFQQRIRWWSALALLRSISSSPAAAVATLRARANSADAQSETEADELGRRGVLDLSDTESGDAFDVAPGADAESGDSQSRRQLLALAREAEGLRGTKDRKLMGLVETVRKLQTDGFSPIVFCKYIPTAEYVADELRQKLKGTEVACVTGQLPHDEREARVSALAEQEKRVLVCTDCLSEGINLQESFDAVLHADLAWTPTRHEQREGRVDRFNQKSATVRVVTFYGEDNPIDGIVLNILLTKHKRIRNSLGISVPVPVDSDKVLEAVFESLVLKGISSTSQLGLFDDAELPGAKDLETEWQRAADREKKSRTLFAQNAIKVDEVAPELEEVRRALGSPLDLERFVREALRGYGALLESKPVFTVNLSETPRALRDALSYEKPFKATFALSAPRGVVALTRTQSFVESLASFVTDAALAQSDESVAVRCAVTATSAVKELTTLLVLRFRFQIVGQKSEMLAEDTATVAFRGQPTKPVWLPSSEAEALLAAPPSGNIAPELGRRFLDMVLAQQEALQPELERLAQERAAAVLASHRRVRKALESSHAAREVRVQGAPDILGIYLLMPHAGGH
ncbi:DEAD/DEAH box helicase [Armatimonas sp.]|uniref:DEAD/DEAH box helicase n=1 Tax=Armatimonas sp. TaxID=1872638 RepID=UPI0037508783